MSGAAFEWYSSNTKSAYPFPEKQSDDIHELFVDAYVLHNKHRDKTGLRIHAFNTTGDLTLKFADGTTLVTLTSADNFTSTSFGAFTIYAWRRSTTIGVGFTDEDLAVSLVVQTAELGNFSFPLSPSDGTLLASLVNPRLQRVRRVAVSNGPLGDPCCIGGGFVTSDRIILEAGNNLEIEVPQDDALPGLGIIDTDTKRAPTTVDFDATAGQGAGQFSDCTAENPAIKRINNVGPADNGSLLLQGQDCTWVERKIDSTGSPVHPHTDFLASMTEALLQLHQDCDACCDCAEYGEAYEAIKRQWNNAYIAAVRIEAVRQQYNALVSSILSIKASKEDGLNVRISAVSRPDFHLALSALMYNNSKYDLGLVTITFTLDVDGFIYTTNSGRMDMETAHGIQINPVISGNELEVTMPFLNGAKYAVYTLDVRWPPLAENRSGLTVRPTVVATSGSQVASDGTVVELVAPLVKS